MQARRVLLQLDADSQPSSFDSIVAIDSDVEHLLTYHSVAPNDVQALVHGAIFTRGIENLSGTAIFIGGSKMAKGEELLQRVCASFIGPMRVSVMLDTGGANTTAAAAVLCAARHLKLADCTAIVLGATGPVGERAVRLLAGQGAHVCAVARDQQRAEQVRQRVEARFGSVRRPHVKARKMDSRQDRDALLQIPADLVISAGAAGVELAALADWQSGSKPKLVIDLNAVPPTGIQGVAPTDRACEHDGILCYGALGVGRLKMKLHRELVRRLFTQNDLVLDAEQAWEIGREFTDG
jgi:hypothetical protein